MAEIHPSELVRSELLADILRGGGAATLRVHGTSMAPTVRPGDVVKVDGCEISSVRCEDIVLFCRAGRLYLHRVLERRESHGQVFLRTRGDRLSDCDLPVGAAEFLGRLTAAFRGAAVAPVTGWRQALLRVVCRFSDTATALLVSSSPVYRPLER